jgi:hypothetical protein
MPVKKLNFSLAPINDNPVNVNGGNFTDGFTHKNGFPTVKFSIPAQNVLLDVNNLYLSGQLICNDSNGTPITTNQANKAVLDVNNGSATIRKQCCLNTSNWNGTANVIDKVVLQSKKTQTELQSIINYSPYNALNMGSRHNDADYIESPMIRNMATGVNHGSSCRRLVNTPQTGAGEGRIDTLSDKFVGQFFSFKLDVAMLQSQMIHLGNDFAGGLLLTLHLNPDAAFFHSRFRSINAATTNADITGVSYVLKNLKLEGKYVVPTPADLKAYNPVITMNSRVNLMNDIVSTDNANTFTPQLQMVKGVVNTFLDDNQQNNFLLNQNNFRVPLGLVQYQQAKNNIRYPYDFATEIVPNAESLTTAGAAMTINLARFPVSVQGDAELRLQFGRALTGGRLPAHTSATINLTNESMKADIDADTANSNTIQRGDNTKPDLLGVAADYANNVGQLQNFVNQDYELKVKSGINSGRATLPAGRNGRISIQESYLRNFSQIDLRTLQKVQ